MEGWHIITYFDNKCINEGQNTNSTANQMQNIYTSRITVGSTNIAM
jgi:hypothetical protein